MIIVKCNKCGEFLHKADKCFACGNTTDFEKLAHTTVVHENVHDEYERLENLVRTGKFEEAIAMSRLVLEWMPSCSDVFWMRVLIKNRCKSDEELIRKGFSVSESADYHNAVLFGNEEQKKVYALVATKIDAVQKALKAAIIEHEYAEKAVTPIVQLQAELPTEIETRRVKLFDMWNQLEAIEHEMLAIEKDCLLLVQEHKDALNSASSAATALKNQTYKMEECPSDKLHKYQTQFGDLLNQSEQAKSAIDSMKKQHPWMATYNELVVKRDSLVNQITSELSSLKSYENRVQSTVSEIERIETRHKNALKAIMTYRFADARNLLGENRFTAAFAEAGVR